MHVERSQEQPPLAGYRVVDFGQYMAGPAVGKMLAEQGAEVIRVSPPAGPRWDSPAEAILNRSKEACTLDLKTPAGRDAAIALVETADVLVENFRPGVMERLGLGTAAMMARNPSLVYLSLPGFAAADGERAHIQAWEGVIAASAGMYTDMGLNRVLMGVGAAYSPLPLASAYGASLGALAVLAALYERRSSGHGDCIEVPLASALMEGLAYNAMHIDPLPERYKSLREREIERRRAVGERMDMTYEALQRLLDPFYRNFECADGRPFYNCCQSHRQHPVKSLQLLGLWDEAVSAGLPLHDPYLPTHDWPEGTDCTLYAYPLSQAWTDFLSARMQQAFRTRPSTEWEQLYAAHGIPGAAQRTTREWLHSEHPLASGLLRDVEDPVHGRMREPGPLLWLRDRAGRPLDDSGPPRTDAGAPTDEPVSAPPRDTSGHVDGGKLAGIRILDLTNVVAGPTIASTLARFGAEVIKIDPMEPTLDPWNTVIFGILANRGKRSMLLDIRSDEGREVLYELLKQVDVVTFNGLDRQLDALGLDAETVASINPELVFCRADAFGGPGRGPRSDDLGYDDTVQASTGVMARFGGSLETPEEHAHFGTIDVMGGFFAACSIVLALLHRGRGGQARRAESSLAAAGQFIQTPFMFDYPGRPAFDEPSGPGARGEHALYGLYQAADGWFFLGARRADIARLAALPELAGIETLAEPDLRVALEHRFADAPAGEWVQRLVQAGVGAHTADSIESLRERYLVPAPEAGQRYATSTYLFSRHDDHPSGRTVDLVPPNAIRFDRSPVAMLGDAPKNGTHTFEVLEEIGIGAERAERLREDGIVANEWPHGNAYLPD